MKKTEMKQENEVLQEYRITAVRRSGRNICFRQWARSLTEAVEKGQERIKGDYECITAREI